MDVLWSSTEYAGGASFELGARGGSGGGPLPLGRSREDRCPLVGLVAILLDFARFWAMLKLEVSAWISLMLHSYIIAVHDVAMASWI